MGFIWNILTLMLLLYKNVQQVIRKLEYFPFNAQKDVCCVLKRGHKMGMVALLFARVFVG